MAATTIGKKVPTKVALALILETMPTEAMMLEKKIPREETEIDEGAGMTKENLEVAQETVTVMMDATSAVKVDGDAVALTAKSLRPKLSVSVKRPFSAVLKKPSVRLKKHNAMIALYL